ncbi:glutathione S-transferase family protein [Glaciecola siphonariae]|uniref:Glutathione S-transferase family protein n=1 Tax=Glaciecola siphonariae TaxID=521012 RepID=A0ABV9LYP2_9ALTE
MFTLHHLKDSRSQRIVWLLEMIGADYQIKAYARDPQTSLAPEEFKRLHPLGSAPLLEHNDEMLAESGAICEYIVQQADAKELLKADDPSAHIQVQFWSHYSEGSFLPPLVAAMVMNKARAKAKPFFVKFIANKLIDAILDAYFNKVISRNLAFVEAHLADKTFFVGDSPTIADVQMSFGMEALQKTDRLKAFPNMSAYVARVQAIPSYQAAMKKMAEAEASINQ